MTPLVHVSDPSAAQGALLALLILFCLAGIARLAVTHWSA